MKISNSLIILSIFFVFTQTALVNEMAVETLVRSDNVEKVSVDFETIESTKRAPQQSTLSIEAISNEMEKSAYLETKPRFNTYNLATNFFNSQRYFGDVCDRCKKF